GSANDHGADGPREQAARGRRRPRLGPGVAGPGTHVTTSRVRRHRRDHYQPRAGTASRVTAGLLEHRSLLRARYPAAMIRLSGAVPLAIVVLVVAGCGGGHRA